MDDSRYFHVCHDQSLDLTCETVHACQTVLITVSFDMVVMLKCLNSSVKVPKGANMCCAIFALWHGMQACGYISLMPTLKYSQHLGSKRMQDLLDKQSYPELICH